MDKGTVKKGNVKKAMAAALLLLGLATAWAGSHSQTPLSSNVQAVSHRVGGGGDGMVTLGFPPPVGQDDPTPTPK